jgi:asparagine synthase (glutamine-hydrolysing)
MQQISERPVRTFSVGFWEPKFDEAPFARKIAEHLGTSHTELIVTPREALDVIPRLPQIYDEPFADSSQIPTFLIAHLARKDVTVALSGDGGDELCGGYGRYADTLARWSQIRRVPLPVRSIAGHIVEALPLGLMQLALAPLRHADRFKGRGDLADRLRERAALWHAGSLLELYQEHHTIWKQPALAARSNASESQEVAVREDCGGDLGELKQMMYADLRQYLPDDILVKVDRAAMAVSLETRIPLLDPEVVRTAWRIPSVIHRQDGREKWVLRQILERRVPRELFERPKKGFSVPIAQWLRGELRPWAEGLIHRERLRRDGFFEPATIERLWRQHLAGTTDWSAHLWGVLMFQAWRDAWH